jgi:hypothetical protein
VEVMAAAGVTGVLCVQTDIDIKHRGINWPRMVEYYSANNIRPEFYPIHDFNEEDLTKKILNGAKLLDEMINQDGR